MASHKITTAVASALTLLLLCFVAQLSSAQSTKPEVRYAITFSNLPEHKLLVSVSLPPGVAEQDLQLPVWNALYQVRDFSQYLNWIHASNSGKPLPLVQINSSRWHLSGAQQGAQIDYEIIAKERGPYGAELSTQHAFFNLAEVLIYSDSFRAAPIQIHYSGVPAGWRAATALPGTLDGGFQTENYDRIVDSPIEFGSFQEQDFDEGGGHYRVVVDTPPDDYNSADLMRALQAIVASETKWMDDRPFQQYLFIFHFPHTSGGGGMEHAYGTAIELNADDIKQHPRTLYSVSAHEFFHLWNVKRIRPQSLEPVDYTKENYTPSLWFSEGFTSTVASYTLSRTGLQSEHDFLHYLARVIADVEARPAHLTQSAEESSLDAWLEKYTPYWRPERSISYYEKGELIGILLDLALRNATQDHQSLRELFQAMNREYAKNGKPFPDTDGIRQTAESLTHTSLQDFFRTYVSGTAEIPWDDFFQPVGLHLIRESTTVADTGFTAARSFDAEPAITFVTPGSEAERAGLREGDQILELNGNSPGHEFLQKLRSLPPGDTIHLKIRGETGERDLQWKVGSRSQSNYRLEDVKNLTDQQKSRRAAWLRGEAEPLSAHPAGSGAQP